MITDIPLNKISRSKLCVIGSYLPHYDQIKSYLINDLNCNEIPINNISELSDITSKLRSITRENKIDNILNDENCTDPFKYIIDLNECIRTPRSGNSLISNHDYMRSALKNINDYIYQENCNIGVIVLSPIYRKVPSFGNDNTITTAFTNGNSLRYASDLVMTYDYDNKKYNVIKNRYGTR